MIQTVNLILGGLLLVAGKRLFWLVVGVIGFVAGMTFANNYFPGESDLAVLIISLMAGALGVVLAFFVKRLMIGIAGFVVGVMLTNYLLGYIDAGLGIPNWILLLGGGIIGLVLVSLVFDWALVLLSSVVGAYLLTEYLPIPPELVLIAFGGITVAGVIIQSSIFRR